MEGDVEGWRGSTRSRCFGVFMKYPRAQEDIVQKTNVFIGVRSGERFGVERGFGVLGFGGD